MSLEQAIQENTAAINFLIEALKRVAPGKVVDGIETDLATQGPVTRTPKKPAEKKPEPEVEKVEKAAENETKGDDTKPIEYTDVRNAVMAIAKTDRTKAEAVLQRFGVTQISKLKPEQYADVLEYATKVINDEVDPAAGEGDLE